MRAFHFQQLSFYWLDFCKFHNVDFKTKNDIKCGFQLKSVY